MERIQSALAKARTRRAALDRTSSRRATETPVGPGPAARPGAAADEAWSRIPRFEPKARRLNRSRVVTAEAGAAGAEFDRLRTRSLQKMKAHDWHRLAVVSPTAQNGKSTVTLNLAFSLARQRGLRTIVLELDMRRPRLAGMLGLKGKQDFSRVLTGDGAFEEHAVRLRDNLILAPSRPVQSGSAELLQTAGAIEAIEAVVRDYAPEIVLFDLPPVGIGDDTLGFLSNADCALLVAAAGQNTLDEVDTCERDVAERTEMLGVVLNKCRYETGGEGYGYYY